MKVLPIHSLVQYLFATPKPLKARQGSRSCATPAIDGPRTRFQLPGWSDKICTLSTTIGMLVCRLVFDKLDHNLLRTDFTLRLSL